MPVEVVRSRIKKYSQVKYYKIDIKENVIFIYLVDQDISMLSKLLESAPGTRGKNLSDIIDELISYSPMMRFVLVDAKRRQYTAERYCFLGSIDDWILIGETDELSELVKKYVKHLGQDSYYEL